MKTLTRTISLFLAITMFLTMASPAAAGLFAFGTVSRDSAEPVILTANGDEYTVNVECSPEAEIPQNAALIVREMEDWTAEKDTIPEGYEMAFLRAFDISIVGEDGTKLQPKTGVKVSIGLGGMDEADEVRVLHYADGEEQPLTDEVGERSDEDEDKLVEEGESFRGLKRSIDSSDLQLGKQSLRGSVSGLMTAKDGSVESDEKLSDGEETVSDPVKEEADPVGEPVEATVEDGVVCFETDGFSVFAILGLTVIGKRIIAANGQAYDITVSCGPETGIPEDADLEVTELLPPENSEDGTSDNRYNEYVAYTENALGMAEGSAGYIRLFDISIVDKNDHSIKYQPMEGTAVGVKIELADKDSSENAAASTQVVHFAEGSETGDIVEAKTVKQTVSFDASGFSIYAIVDDTKIITVNFYDGDGNFISSEYVKKNGDEIEDLYSPGFELEYGESFYGWATSQDANSGIDIDALNASFKANWNSYSEDTPVNYYAVVKKVYVVTFNKHDDEGNLVVLRTMTIPVDQENKTITIPGDLGAEVGSDFQGWLGQDGTLYTEGQPFTVDNHYTFFSLLFRS